MTEKATAKTVQQRRAFEANYKHINIARMRRAHKQSPEEVSKARTFTFSLKLSTAKMAACLIPHEKSRCFSAFVYLTIRLAYALLFDIEFVPIVVKELKYVLRKDGLLTLKINLKYMLEELGVNRK